LAMVQEKQDVLDLVAIQDNQASAMVQANLGVLALAVVQEHQGVLDLLAIPANQDDLDLVVAQDHQDDQDLVVVQDHQDDLDLVVAQDDLDLVMDQHGLDLAMVSDNKALEEATVDQMEVISREVVANSADLKDQCKKGQGGHLQAL